MILTPQQQLQQQFPGLSAAEIEVELNKLTPDERAGLLDPDLIDGVGAVGDPQDEILAELGDQTPPAAAATQAPAAPTKVEKVDDEGDDEPAPRDQAERRPTKASEQPSQQAPAPAVDTAAAPTPPAAAAAAPAVVDDYVPRMRMVMENWKGPENAETTIKSLTEAMETAARKFDDGEISSQEFVRQNADIAAQRAQLQSQIDAANQALAINRASWGEACGDFLDHYPGYRDNPRVLSMLDAEVRHIQEGADNPFDPAILVQARKSVDEAIVALGGKPPHGAAAPARPQTQVKPRQEPIPTLGAAPAADVSETGNPAFDQLDRLANSNPEAYEKALALLSPAQLEAYMQN